VVFSINSDGVTDSHRDNGSASNIDSSGDSVQGNLRVGLGPAHAAVTPNGSKLYVANSAEDSVTSNTTSSPTTVAATVSLPASPSATITQVSGNGSTATYTYAATTQIFSPGDTVYVTGCSTPGFNGAFPIISSAAGSFTVANATSATDNPENPGAQAKLPNAVFAGTAETNNVYVVGYGTSSVYVINTGTDVVNAAVPVGTHPVALAELPNLQQIFVANQGNAATSIAATVSVISKANDTVVNTIPFPAGATPVWVVAKSDSSRVYVLDENGTIYDINPLTANADCTAAIPPAVGVGCFAVTTIGPGTNALRFDPIFNRLYVTNPTNSAIGVLDAGADPPRLMNTINLATAAASACSGCAPDAVTVLGDGSRAYVAAYQFSPGCTDYSGNAVNCVKTLVAVIDGLSGTLKSIVPNVSGATSVPTISSAPAITSSACGPAVGPVPSLWQPGVARFRASITSSGGGANSNFKVYLGQCDSGSVAVIDTFTANGNSADTYAGISLNAPLSSFPPLASGYPPPQNPVLVIAGP
jgi:YVTN family beta-propeller protein